ncbi:hypothetical protein CPB86DRAFT_872137 [Serendipita vermifera]|nr:hypothetical protein CPB86DRAFT_872137 [Serendipita vermifera]
MNRRTKAPKPGTFLIPDIIEIVLQFLLVDDQRDSRDYGQRRKSLRQRICNYAQISKDWRLPVQRILFAEVDIWTRHKLKTMGYIIPNHTAQGRFLRGCVRSLRLWVLSQEEGSSLRPEDIPYAMRQFPALYELRLDTKSLSSFNPEIMRDLQKTPSIQALMLTRSTLKRGYDHEIEERGQIEFDLQLLCKVPHWKLRRFVLGRGLQVQCRASPSPPHQLEEVRFHGMIKGGRQPEFISKGIGWYLQNSMETLQVFSTTCPEYTPSMIRSYGNNRIQSAEFLRIDSKLFSFGTFRGLKELMWLDIQPPWRPQNLLPMKSLSHMDNIVHLGFQFSSESDWAWDLDFGHAIMAPQKTKNKPPPPPSLPVNVRRISIIGYTSSRFKRQSVQERIQKRLGDDIEVRLYGSLREYKEGIPLKLIPQDYEVSSCPKTVDYSTMTRLVNQADERSGQQSTTFRASRAKSNPPVKKLPWK